MSCAFKLTTTSPGFQTASSFMNRHTTCLRVTTQDTTMSHFLNILDQEYYQMLSACCFCSFRAFSCNHLWLCACLCLPSLVDFWIGMPVNFGSALFSSPCLCLRGCLEDRSDERLALCVGWVSAGRCGGHAGATN